MIWGMQPSPLYHYLLHHHHLLLLLLPDAKCSKTSQLRPLLHMLLPRPLLLLLLLLHHHHYQHHRHDDNGKAGGGCCIDATLEYSQAPGACVAACALPSPTPLLKESCSAGCACLARYRRL